MPVDESLEKDGELPNQTETALDESVAQEKECPTSKANGSGSSSFDNMESLLVDEDENDDPLGTDSLRLSGSESDDGEKVSPARRKKRAHKILNKSDDDKKEDEKQSPVHQKKRATQILDSDEDDKEHDVEEQGKAKVSPVTQRRRAAQILDSDDEDKQEVEAVEEPLDNVQSEPHKPKKFSALIDSDSEDEEVLQTRTMFSDLIDSDSEPEEASNQKEKKGKKHKKSKETGKSRSRISKPAKSDSDDERESATSRKASDLIDPDSELSLSSDAGNEETVQNEEHGDDEIAVKAPKKKQRASAKKAIDEIQAIQSETQRLYRETQVSIPYHKPKRHTLKEFLTRRTIVKPQLGQGGSGKKLKMSAEELEAYAKQLEERANEAKEFFKSESEDELEDIIQKDGEKNNDPEETAIEVPVSDSEKPTEEAQEIDMDEVDKIVEAEVLPSNSTAQELMDIEVPDESESENVPETEAEPKAMENASEPLNPLSELKRRLIAEKNLTPFPTLRGDPNMIIDFETGDMVPPKPTGLESLFQRFVKCNAIHKKKPKEGSSAMSVEKTPLEISKIAVSIIEEPNKEKEPKPGAAYVKLKESLRSLITKKRKEDIQKKKEETQEEEDEYNKCCGLDYDDEEEEREKRHKKVEREILIDDEENEIELLEDDGDELEDHNEEAGGADEDDGDAVADDEGDQVENGESGDEDEDEDEEDEEDDSDEDEEVDETENPSTKKHRIIKAFEDSDDEKDKVDAAGLNTTSTSVLFAEEEKKNPEEVEDELLGLCSGQFEESQRAPLISQIPITQSGQVIDDTELMNLCSGVFNEVPESQAKSVTEIHSKNAMKILSSDEEKEPQEEESTTNDSKKVKKLKKKMKKRAKLGFSDDEDDEEEQQDLQDSFDEEEEKEEDIPQTYIDYDSEENEIEVQMTKKEALKQANAFVENEAELSESEWGSADEDEQNLDKYDIELGDEDEFDRDKIRTELEQIHMRKVLDDDIREVKKIQDMLFDNEEVDGVGRERKFRWKNVESGFALDDPAGGDGDNDENGDSCDDEEEMQWRKMRFEREQLLKQKTKEEILAEVSATSLGKALLSTMEPEIKQKFEITKEVLVAKEYKKPSFLILQNDVKSMSGSFLNYDKESLARIAETVSKSGLPDDDEQMQQKASKRGNFVFAPLSEEEQAIRKRKAEEVQNAKSGNLAKKSKPNQAAKKPLLLDKLL